MLHIRPEPRAVILLTIQLDEFAVFVHVVEASIEETEINKLFIAEDNATRGTFDVRTRSTDKGFGGVDYSKNADASPNGCSS